MVQNAELNGAKRVFYSASIFTIESRMVLDFGENIAKSLLFVCKNWFLGRRKMVILAPNRKAKRYKLIL